MTRRRMERVERDQRVDHLVVWMMVAVVVVLLVVLLLDCGKC